jgi:hypothetical protein
MEKTNEQMIEYAKSRGINITIDPSLTKESRVTICPEKVKAAKEVLTNLKWDRERKK